MTPQKSPSDQTYDLFRMRLENMIDLKHALVKLSQIIDWDALESEFSSLYEPHMGRPAKSIRLMASLLLLQHTHNLSDEDVVNRWRENPYWQFFSGETYFSHDLPIDPSSLTRWRKRIGKEGSEKILALTIQAGIRTQVIRKSDIKRVIVDTTVQEKNIAFPRDSQLYLTALKALTQLAKDNGILLRQTYARKAKALSFQISRYAHAKQFKRMKKSLKTLKCYLGRVYRDILRQINTDLRNAPKTIDLIEKVEKLLSQSSTSKNKLYSLHAPEVECISKGKARKAYEFGNKVSVATPLSKTFVIGINSLQGNPYDGHTLKDQLAQVSKLTGIEVGQVFADQGYKGHGIENTEVFLSRQKRGITKTLKRHLKRRQSIEPLIGHLKVDGKMGRNTLKGVLGNEINALLSGAGFNLRTILNKIKSFFPSLFHKLISTPQHITLSFSLTSTQN